jgi:excisionase family DNA binding protein
MDTITIALPDAALEAIAQRVASIIGTINGPDLLTPEEAAVYLHCEPRRLNDLKYRGTLRGIKEGGRLLFERAELDRHLDLDGQR